MPELPEVEIHARNQRAWLVGRRIESFEILDPLLTIEPGSPEALLPGATVAAVGRDAKYLLIDLDNAHTLVAHLRMTGRFTRAGYLAGNHPKHTRLVLRLDSGEIVRFEDRRKFGRVWLSPSGAVRELSELAELGPDALLEPTSSERLRELARNTQRAIKLLLMDQQRIGGIGNICAIEILYRAGIHPAKPSNRLTGEEVERIARIIPEYLEWAIDVQSRRELLYIGEKGAENVFPIYRREGVPCPQCGAAIARTVLGGRGTYHCPACQRLDQDRTT